MSQDNLNNTKLTSDVLLFDSYFEGGNLDFAIQIQEQEYDLYIRPDTNTKGHTLWYYFRVRNMKRGQKVRFNINNITKPNALYREGKRPYFLSQIEQHVRKQEWNQIDNSQHCSFKQMSNHCSLYFQDEQVNNNMNDDGNMSGKQK